MSGYDFSIKHDTYESKTNEAYKQFKELNGEGVVKDGRTYVELHENALLGQTGKMNFTKTEDQNKLYSNLLLHNFKVTTSTTPKLLESISPPIVTKKDEKTSIESSEPEILEAPPPPPPPLEPLSIKTSQGLKKDAIRKRTNVGIEQPEFSNIKKYDRSKFIPQTKITESPKFPSQTSLDDDSKKTFEEGIPGNVFCGAMNIETGKIYFVPLVPRDEAGKPYPNPDNIMVGGVKTPPMRHTDFGARKGGHPGTSSHQQLVDLLTKQSQVENKTNPENFVGFSVLKTENGIQMSFTSRSLNNGKFFMEGDYKTHQEEIQARKSQTEGKKGIPGSDGLLSEEFASGIHSGITKAVV